MKVRKNADLDKYRYIGYGNRFDGRSKFSWSNGGWGKNVVNSGVDQSSSVHVDNKKDILVLGEGLTQGIQVQAKYPANFTRSGRRFCFSLHYNRSNSFLFLDTTEM